MADIWQPISKEEVTAWRRDLPKGWTREDAPYIRDIPTVDSDGDTAAIPIENGGSRGHLEARDTIDRIVSDIIEWAHSDPETLIPKVQAMKRAGGLAHLSDEDAARQLHDLAVKLAADSAERVYKSHGWDQGVTLFGGAV